MTLFKHGDKVRVAVSKTVNGMRRLRIDVRSPESELKESNHWIDTTICGDLSFQIFDPSDNTYLVNGVPGLFNGSTFGPARHTSNAQAETVMDSLVLIAVSSTTWPSPTSKEAS